MYGSVFVVEENVVRMEVVCEGSSTSAVFGCDCIMIYNTSRWLLKLKGYQDLHYSYIKKCHYYRL